MTLTRKQYPTLFVASYGLSTSTWAWNAAGLKSARRRIPTLQRRGHHELRTNVYMNMNLNLNLGGESNNNELEARLRPVGMDGVDEVELARITNAVIGWLDIEYPEESLREPHSVVAKAAAEHYSRVRLNGTDDVGEILLELGGLLEKEMHYFHELFVGPWEIANKVSDIIMRNVNA